MSEIRKQKKNKREKLTWAPPCAAQPAAGPAHLPPLSSSSRQREGSVAGARARHRATPPARLPACPPLLVSMPWTTPRLPPALSHSPSALPSSPSLPHSRPNTTVAAVRHSHRLRPPLAPPTSSGAPPRLPLPPHRSTGLRKPCIAATSPFPSSGSDHHRRRFAALRPSPSPLTIPAAPR